jgi:hypothetical protein
MTKNETEQLTGNVHSATINGKENKYMKEKQLIVTFSDQSLWAIPARAIAHNLAKHSSAERDTEAYNLHYQSALENDHELIGWATQNMEWADVSRFANQIKFAKLAPYAAEWAGAIKTVQ